MGELNSILGLMFFSFQVVQTFFKKHFDKELDRYDKLEFLDFWYVLIIVNDILTIAGSILKIQIENKVRITHVISSM